MPEKKPTILRLVIPLVILVVSSLMLVLIVRNASRPKPAPPQPTPATAGAPQAGSPSPNQPSNIPVLPAATPATPATPIEGLTPRPLPPEATASLSPLAGEHPVHLEFTPVGAGIRLATLHDYHPTATSKDPVHIQAEQARQLSTGQTIAISPAAAMAVQINGTWVPLSWGPSGPVWREVAPGSFEAHIDAGGMPILRLTRAFEPVPDSHSIAIRQGFENLSGQPLDIRLEQFGTIELPGARTEYGGDKRRVRFGYLLSPQIDAARSYVQAGEFLWSKQRALGSRDKSKSYTPAAPLWPNPRSQEQGYSLTWVGLTNRHFAASLFPILPPTGPREWRGVEKIERILLDPAADDPAMILKVTSSPIRLAAAGDPAAKGEFSVGLYLGPLSKKVLRADPLAAPVALDSIVVYNFGGWCGAYCTFAWVTILLEGLLHFLHDNIFFDWSLAIIFLVVCVRTCLHPVTRWSQIRMQRFAKQMQDLGPKQKLIQERYAGDQAKIREETQRLWREEGVNPAGMLGCIPMFLQTPIWIALYATLYFAFELRQEPAFFGLFQAATGGAWGFLADLSEPDGAIPFGRGFHIPLISGLMGEIRGINILPLILGAVFYIHQKYLTPPTTATLTPEQKQQQQMIKIISVVMFPVFMYNAPSGLSLYFITNSTLAIFESRWIRAHIDKHKLLDVKRRPKAAGGGFIARLQAAAEQRAKMVEQAKKRKGR